MGSMNREGEIFGRVGLYQPYEDVVIHPVQMRGFFANLSEEFQDYYVQVTSAATGDVYEFVDFESREARRGYRGGFFVGNDSEEADYEMCLGDNCDPERFGDQFAVMAGDKIQLISYGDPTSSHLGGECVLEVKECHH